MKKIMALFIFGLLCWSTFSMFTPHVKTQEIVWNTNPTPLPVPLTEHASVVYNGKIYVLGGNTIGWIWLDTVYFADILPDGTISSWMTTTPLPEVRGDFEAVVWNGYVYVMGGSTTGGAYLDTVLYAQIQPAGTLGGWMTTTSLPTTVAGFASAVWNGRIYVIIGGWPGWKGEVYSAEINPDGSLSGWRPENSLPAPRRSPATIVRDGVIYVIGGQYESGTYHNTVYYALINPDGSVGSWSTTTPLPGRRENAEAVLHNGDIHVIGGNQRSALDEIYDTVFRATINPDGSVASWITENSLPEPRMTHIAVVYDGIIYVLGGIGLDGIKDTIYYSSTLAPEEISATVDIDPDTLNLKSNGQWITAYITLPEGYSVGDINVASVELMHNDVVVEAADWGEVQDGVLMVKFDRATLRNYLGEVDVDDGDKFYDITLTVTGSVAGTTFEGSDRITVKRM